MKSLNDVGRGLVPTFDNSELRELRVASEMGWAREMLDVVVVAINSRLQKLAKTVSVRHEGVCLRSRSF